MRRAVIPLLAISLVPVMAMGDDTGLESWKRLRQVRPGQRIEIVEKDEKSIRGEFDGLTEDAITVRAKSRAATIPRAQVRLVRFRKGARATWIGLGIGAGAGAGIGAAAGAAVSNSSARDFANLTPAIIAVCAGLGALTGALIGSVMGGRHAVIYRAK